MNEEERVLCAAIYCDDGKTDPPRRSHSYPATGLVFAGWRHSDCYTALMAWSDRLTAEERRECNVRDYRRAHPDAPEFLSVEQVNAMHQGVRGFDQGFLTTKGRYVTREEAFQIAKRAEQLPENLRGRATYPLTSEDLY